jgi:hypothetical protein
MATPQERDIIKFDSLHVACSAQCKQLGDCYICAGKIQFQQMKVQKQKEVIILNFCFY